jgi:hypothetical protein
MTGEVEVGGRVSGDRKRVTWVDFGAACLLVAATLAFVWCWVRMGDGVQDGQGGPNITGYWVLLLSSAAVGVVAVSFLAIRIHRLWTMSTK